MAACSHELRVQNTQPPQVTVKTSDVPGAGTDAAVGLVLVGASGSSGPHPLDNDGRCFKRGEQRWGLAIWRHRCN